MATHSSVLAWRIPGTGKPGGLPSRVTQSRTRLKQLSSSSSGVFSSPSFQRESKCPRESRSPSLKTDDLEATRDGVHFLRTHQASGS